MVFRFQQIPFHHFGFIAALAQAVQPLVPSFIPRTYQFVSDPFSLQISNQKIFTIMEDLDFQVPVALPPKYVMP